MHFLYFIISLSYSLTSRKCQEINEFFQKCGCAFYGNYSVITEKVEHHYGTGVDAVHW